MAGLLVLELLRAEIAECGMQSAFIVSLVDEARKVLDDIPTIHRELKRKHVHSRKHRHRCSLFVVQRITIGSVSPPPPGSSNLITGCITPATKVRLAVSVLRYPPFEISFYDPLSSVLASFRRRASAAMF